MLLKNELDFVSIIMTHFAMDSTRSATMRASIKSLLESTEYPYELIVVDNGESLEDSTFLLDLTHKGKIHTYIRNSNNRHFGYARNQALSIAQGNYISIIDNDLIYKKDWLKDCVRTLELFPSDKYYATPMSYPSMCSIDRYSTGEIVLGNGTYKLNSRAGSNCFVIRREAMREIGAFPCHRIGGSLWTNNAVKAGYNAIVIPGDMATDIGLRNGYNLKETIPIELPLANAGVVLFNEDSLKESSVCSLQRVLF